MSDFWQSRAESLERRLDEANREVEMLRDMASRAAVNEHRLKYAIIDHKMSCLSEPDHIPARVRAANDRLWQVVYG